MQQRENENAAICSKCKEATEAIYPGYVCRDCYTEKQIRLAKELKEADAQREQKRPSRPSKPGISGSGRSAFGPILPSQFDDMLDQQQGPQPHRFRITGTGKSEAGETEIYIRDEDVQLAVLETLFSVVDFGAIVKAAEQLQEQPQQPQKPVAYMVEDDDPEVAVKKTIEGTYAAILAAMSIAKK